MAESSDFIYENAPLVEVIAEVRWRLVRIVSIPGAELDPMFERGYGKLKDLLEQEGFRHLERSVPEQFRSKCSLVNRYIDSAASATVGR